MCIIWRQFFSVCVLLWVNFLHLGFVVIKKQCLSVKWHHNIIWNMQCSISSEKNSLKLAFDDGGFDWKIFPKSSFIQRQRFYLILRNGKNGQHCPTISHLLIISNSLALKYSYRHPKIPSFLTAMWRYSCRIRYLLSWLI